MNKKEGVSCITTHLHKLYVKKVENELSNLSRH